MIREGFNPKSSPFLGLHAMARDAPHQSKDKGHSASVHTKKNAWEGDIYLHIYP